MAKAASDNPARLTKSGGRPIHLTPDGRYLVVRGRLWRATNPSLTEPERQRLTGDLMDARRAVKSALHADDPTALRVARKAVDDAKQGLGERGPVWWGDGMPDLNRRMAHHTPYAGWWASMQPTEIGSIARSTAPDKPDRST